jgi:hypothetical protein
MSSWHLSDRSTDSTEVIFLQAIMVFLAIRVNLKPNLVDCRHICHSMWFVYYYWTHNVIQCDVFITIERTTLWTSPSRQLSIIPLQQLAPFLRSPSSSIHLSPGLLIPSIIDDQCLTPTNQIDTQRLTPSDNLEADCENSTDNPATIISTNPKFIHKVWPTPTQWTFT